MALIVNRPIAITSNLYRTTFGHFADTTCYGDLIVLRDLFVGPWTLVCTQSVHIDGNLEVSSTTFTVDGELKVKGKISLINGGRIIVNGSGVRNLHLGHYGKISAQRKKEVLIALGQTRWLNRHLITYYLCWTPRLILHGLPNEIKVEVLKLLDSQTLKNLIRAE